MLSRFSMSAVSLLLFSASAQASQLQASLAQAARTILEKNCMPCHGNLQLSGLDLRQRATILKGGSRGPAVILGKAEESPLYLAASQKGELKMPPKKPPLAPEDLEVLRKWINQGAAWEASGPDRNQISEQTWWSFRKPRQPPIPKPKAGKRVQNPVDAFVLAKLDENGLVPAPPADRRTLIRRAYFDLIGLPPTPEQVESFARDASAGAYERLIADLLESPHYGERWARHWLDVVRYSDSGGYDTDMYYRNAWRYRDYVVKSLNEDKPYDRFLQEQIAGDELWPDNLDLHGSYSISPEKLEHLEAHIGTGLYTFGPQVHESSLDHNKLRYETLTDWADTTAAVFMGLTLGCARCHDHKFDPISQRDYYRFQAIFSDSKEVEIPIVNNLSIVGHKQVYPQVIVVDEARTAYRLFEKKVKQRVVEAQKSKFPKEVVEAYEIAEDMRTPEQQKLAAPLRDVIESIKLENDFTAEEAREQARLLRRIGKAFVAVDDLDGNGIPFDGVMEVPTASVLGHHNGRLIPDTNVLNRGDLSQPKEKVGPGLPLAISYGTDMEGVSGGLSIPQNRAKLALWLSEPDHPLTSRVMVNRIWQWHFGEGIVRTPNDFGQQGQLPTHPELIDWLATQFVARGWSIKSMHRLIMLSSTYQMSSQFSSEKNAAIDPVNRYLWRMNRRRLEGEELWDTIHAVAGTLTLKVGGRPAVPPLAEDELSVFNLDPNIVRDWKWPVSADPAEHSRRGIYMLRRRNFSFPMFEAFDNPDSAASCPMRADTTVASQALWLLNNRVVFQQAQQFAARLVKEEGNNPSAWVERAWRLALGRAPSDQEEREARKLMGYLAKSQCNEETLKAPSEAESILPCQLTSLTKLCLAILNMNELTYVD